MILREGYTCIFGQNMARAVFFCAVALLLLVSVESSGVKTCKVDKKNKCKASCPGGVSLDITKALKNGK